MAKRLTLYIFVGLALGLLVGWAINAALADGTAAGQVELATIASYFSVVSNLFLRLIKMIIAPLVFATLVSGIVHMADTSALGRIGGRALGWFVGASFVSLLLGLLLVNVFKPGVGLDLDLPVATASADIATADFSIAKFVTHLVPTSMFDAMANNEILQIVVLSLFVGVGITSLGSGGRRLAGLVEEMVAVMLKITEYVMRVAPIAVFAAVAAAVIERGVGIVVTFGYFIGVFYLGLAALWLVLLAAAWALLRANPVALLRHIREPILLAFSTASSEAAFPRTLEALDRSGVPRRISSFVLPLGYSFNLDGSMMYMAFAIMFIAQAYGVEMDLWQQFSVLLILMVTSKGVAGVPRASLVVVAATLSFVNLPEAGLLLVLAIDHFLDMGRTATNVVGNAVACTAVARWEGVLGIEEGDGRAAMPVSSPMTLEIETPPVSKT
jgi:Na+/H+-dicarboxylate symporter